MMSTTTTEEALPATSATPMETAEASSASGPADSTPVYSYSVQSLRDALPDALHIHTEASQLRQKPSATVADGPEAEEEEEEEEEDGDEAKSDMSEDEEMERLYEENKDWYGAVVMPCLRRTIAKKKTDLDAFFIEQPRLLLASAQGTGKKIALCEQLKRLKSIAGREKKPFRVLWITPSSADYDRMEALLQEHTQLPFDAYMDPHTLVPSSSDEDDEAERKSKGATDRQKQRVMVSGAAASFRHKRKRLAKKQKATVPDWVDEAKRLREELLERRRERRLTRVKEEQAAAASSSSPSPGPDVSMGDALPPVSDAVTTAATSDGDGGAKADTAVHPDADAKASDVPALGLVPSPSPAADVEKRERQKREQQRKADRDLLLPVLFEHDCVLLGMDQFYSWIKFGNRYFSERGGDASSSSPAPSSAAGPAHATSVAESKEEDAVMREATAAPLSEVKTATSTQAASGTESVRWSIPSFDVIVLDETARTRDAYFRMCDIAQARAERATSDAERAALRNIIPLFSTSLKTLAHEARHLWGAEAIITLNIPPGPKVMDFLKDLMPNNRSTFALQNLAAPVRQPRFCEASSLSNWCTSLMLFVLGVKKLDISSQYKARKNVALPYSQNALGQQRNHILVLTDDDEQTWDILEARLQYKQERLTPYVFPFDPELPAFQQKCKAFHAIFLHCRRVASIHTLTKHAMRFAAQDVVVPFMYLWCDEVEEHANMTRKEKNEHQKRR